MKKNGGIEIDIDVISNVADPESCQKECQKNLMSCWPNASMT